MPSPLIDIPCDDIFKHDRLGLEPAIESRTAAILSRSPQAIAIDGHWGTGKSTFLALWAAYLRREGIKVVQFNAWKAFEADPLDVLTREILRQVGIPNSEQKPPHKRLLAFLDRYASIVGQGTKLVSSLQPDLEGVSQAIEMGLQMVPKVTRPSSECTEAEGSRIESPEAFAALLSSAAKTWSERPVVVMIDELDRCSPEYAVEMLQLLEHVFHAEQVVFVVAVNRSELIQSIKSFYGQGFNAEGYLERFFDDILALPASNRVRYIESSLNSIAVDKPSALLFLEASGLSLREIDKAVRHMVSVLDNYPDPSYVLGYLWVARTLAPVPYRQFVLGDISDKMLTEAIFGKGACERLRAKGEEHNNSYAREMEAILIASSCILRRGSVPSYYDEPATKSELYRYHQRVKEKATDDEAASAQYSGMVLSQVKGFLGDFPWESDRMGIQQAVRVLERESSSP